MNSREIVTETIFCTKSMTIMYYIQSSSLAHFVKKNLYITYILLHVHLVKIIYLHSWFSGVKTTYFSKMCFEIRRKIALSLPTFIVEPTLQATLVQTCSTTLRSMRSLTTPTSTTVYSGRNFKMLSKNTLHMTNVSYETPQKEDSKHCIFTV